MGKLFNLKQWLTVADAAKYLTVVLGEDVTYADILRLALDRHLRLSVYFADGAKGRCGRIIPISEASYIEVPAIGGEGTVKLHKGVTLSHNGHPMSIVELEEEVSTLRGVYDLPMIGSERLDIENEYQQLIGGPPVTLVGMDGAFVEGRDGFLCQIQDDFDDNEFQPGSKAALERLKRHCLQIQENDPTSEGAAEAESLLTKYENDRKEFLERRKLKPVSERYYPRDGLPEDAMLIVRTEALREFERSINDEPGNAGTHIATTERAHVSDKLAMMNQAAAKWWGNAKRDDRPTHPDNATVTAWLIGKGFSQTLADKAATILRPEWAKTGRRPEE